MNNLIRAIVLISFCATNVLAWDADRTHRDLSEKAAEHSVLSPTKGNYLKNNLGFDKNLKETFILGTDSKYIKDWIRQGSLDEDYGTRLDALLGSARYFNHFHNPLYTQDQWEQAGLSSSWPWVSDGKSSVLWSLNYSNNEWAWQWVRSNYYNALTSAYDTERQEYFAKTFSGLGHIIHLIQDAAQPDHVRNDPHPLDDNGVSPGLEYWAKNRDNQDTVLSFMLTSIPPTLSFNNVPGGYIPITQFFDTDQYDGTNPSTSRSIGLAEYTNANFFSGDTFFLSGFPYPAWSSVEGYEEIINETTGEKRVYLRKIGDGETIEHLATTRLLSDFLPSKYKSLGFKLDDQCYKDYAQKLIPRAVGYSAGLINYFFRGDIDLLEDASSGSGYIIVNNTEEDMDGLFQVYYDKASYDGRGNRIVERILLWQDTLTIGKRDSENPDSNKSQNIQFSAPSDAIKPGKYILVFSGRLGSEENAVVGKVTRTPTDPYIMIMPVNHETREILPKEFYFFKASDRSNTTLSAVSEGSLPFTLLDDGGYWDSMSRTWTKKADRESLGVPLGVGGPQYIAKYWDEENQRVRYLPNLSYEKETYNASSVSVPDSSGNVVKNINYLTYVGSPLLSGGMYNENTGWMEYTDKSLYSVLMPNDDPSQRTFSLYRSINFDDVFVQALPFKSYNFDGSTREVDIPVDGDAPLVSAGSDKRMASIVGAYRPEGADYIKLSVPRIFDTYQKPYSYGWQSAKSPGSSGVDYYLIYPEADTRNSSVYVTSEYKCGWEDNTCGVMDGRAVNSVFNIPYNFNSFITVHQHDNGQYYEEVYINGELVQSSSPALTFETHYQILAVYKNTVLVRETAYAKSYSETPLPYEYKPPTSPDSGKCVYEKQWKFTSKYYIYVNKVRYGPVGGATNTVMKYLDTPYKSGCSNPAQPVEHLTGIYVDDITGYHMDRIFISDTFDGSYVLVAFDEYAYNNGSGLVHDMKYEPSDSDATKHILYYDIPKTEIQNADHEAIRTGRKLLLFKADGTLKQELQDPIGLDKTIGSIGILN